MILGKHARCPLGRVIWGVQVLISLISTYLYMPLPSGGSLVKGLMAKGYFRFTMPDFKSDNTFGILEPDT